MFVLDEYKSKKIQVLRGLAILAVICIHSSPDGFAAIYIRPFFNFAVGLFLFLSGLLSSADRWHPMKRIKKVIIPYAIWTFVYVAMKCDSIYVFPARYIKNFITTNSAPIMYYIFIYCEFTLLIPLIDKLSKSKLKWVGFLITPIELIFIRLIPLAFGINLPSLLINIRHISCLAWFIYFYLGYLIGHDRLDIKASNKTLIICMCIAALLQVFEGYWYYSIGATNIGTQSKITSVLTGIFFVILSYRYLISKDAPTNKVLALYGDKSFGIYFSHILIMNLLAMIPLYSVIAIFPVKAVCTAVISLVVVIVFGKLLGKFAKYLAF